MSPEEWAKARGTRKSLFAAAAVVYRWHIHRHHFGPLMLSGADYDAAMAALTPPYHAPAKGRI